MQASEFPELWASYVNAGQLKPLIDLYADNAVLLPTFSPEHVSDGEGLNDYFENLATKKNLHINLAADTIHCQSLGEQRFIITGAYAFLFEVDHRLCTFPSRYTFVIDLAQSKPILHHHSSQAPTPLPSQTDPSLKGQGVSDKVTAL